MLEAGLNELKISDKVLTSWAFAGCFGIVEKWQRPDGKVIGILGHYEPGNITDVYGFTENFAAHLAAAERKLAAEGYRPNRAILFHPKITTKEPALQKELDMATLLLKKVAGPNVKLITYASKTGEGMNQLKYDVKSGDVFARFKGKSLTAHYKL